MTYQNTASPRVSEPCQRFAAAELRDDAEALPSRQGKRWRIAGRHSSPIARPPEPARPS